MKEHSVSGILKLAVATALIAGVLGLQPRPSEAADQVDIAIISFSPYAPWYIVQEKGFARDIDLNVRIIEDITAKNAALTTGSIQCMLNTLDSVVVARASGVPVKVIAIPAMSYGLDEMIVDSAIESVEDFPGRSYGARLCIPQSHVDAAHAEEGRYRLRRPGSQDHAAPGQRGGLRQRPARHRRQLQALFVPVGSA